MLIEDLKECRYKTRVNAGSSSLNLGVRYVSRYPGLLRVRWGEWYGKQFLPTVLFSLVLI